jgi:hypothetical protein
MDEKSNCDRKKPSADVVEASAQHVYLLITQPIAGRPPEEWVSDRPDFRQPFRLVGNFQIGKNLRVRGAKAVKQQRTHANSRGLNITNIISYFVNWRSGR